MTAHITTQRVEYNMADGPDVVPGVGGVGVVVLQAPRAGTDTGAAAPGAADRRGVGVLQGSRVHLSLDPPISSVSRVAAG